MMIIYIIIRLFANTFVGLMLQVHKPSDPLQPDLMYFLFPRKCGVFGMCSDGIPQQVNYLIDEGHWSSNGSNAGISYLHHLFSKYGLGENYVPLHCDCSGQNTNKYMMWYLAWCCMVGLHYTISLYFLIIGHSVWSGLVF